MFPKRSITDKRVAVTKSLTDALRPRNISDPERLRTAQVAELTGRV
jgi:hypothetical protein